MTRMARQQMATARGGVAAVLGPALRTAFEGQLPVRVRAWDGSETGPEGPTARPVGVAQLVPVRSSRTSIPAAASASLIAPEKTQSALRTHSAARELLPPPFASRCTLTSTPTFFAK